MKTTIELEAEIKGYGKAELHYWLIKGKIKALKDVLKLIDECELKEGFNINPVDLKSRINGK